MSTCPPNFLLQLQANIVIPELPAAVGRQFRDLLSETSPDPFSFTDRQKRDQIFPAATSIIPPMRLDMLPVRQRIHQSENMLPRLAIKPIQQNRIRRAFFPRQLQFRVADNHIPGICNPHFRPNLQNNSHFFAGSHRYLP
jgi:hypothetical protein